MEFKYKIRGLDCAEEVSALRNTVGKLPFVTDLQFDILKARMTVTVNTSLSVEDDIVRAVSKAGLEALPFDETCSSCSHGGEETLWQKQGRFIMCVTSFVFLSGASISHGIIHKSIIDAFVCGEAMSHHSFPLISIILYIISMIFSVWYIIPKVFISVRNLRPDMNVLMTLAMTGAVVIGQWFEASTVMFLFALAQLLEAWSVGRARKAIESLLELSPQKARYICPHDGDILEKPVEEVPFGVTVLVRPGEKIPLDGIVTKGSTTVNQSTITGESVPVKKGFGMEVFAGTINEEGSFEFKVTKTAGDTTLARIIRMVEEAQTRRAYSEQWVEKFARYYTPSMIFLSLFIAIVPPLIFNLPWIDSLYRALVILVISCPCALVISTPVSIIAGLTSAAGRGVLIKGGVHLESPASISAIAFDKTGTLTIGRPEVLNIIPFKDFTDELILSKASSLEIHCKHPLAKAILQKTLDNAVRFTPCEKFHLIKGRGIEGYIEESLYWIGNQSLMEKILKVDPLINRKIEEMEDGGHSVVILGNEREILGLISISDGMKPHTKKVIKSLKELGIKRIVMLTGDNKGTAKNIASSAGLDDFKASLLPEDKVRQVEELVHEYKYVAMVGDGVNDAPSMAVATLGIAMGDIGSDVAIEAADIVLMSDDLERLPWLIKHSKNTLAIIKENIYFAIGLKALFMTLALAGVATLWMAILADTGASLLVIFNSLRLLRVR
jgi:Cd2+/Zn2+-exporting ATPase